jgi:hypothetical protein
VWALREVGGCGATLLFARAVGSLWRATPQAGQRLSCAWLSLYGPSGCRQLQCHAPGFAVILLFGWAFELNSSGFEARRPDHRVGAIADRQLGRIDAVCREPRLDGADDLDDRP